MKRLILAPSVGLVLLLLLWMGISIIRSAGEVNHAAPAAELSEELATGSVRTVSGRAPGPPSSARLPAARLGSAADSSGPDLSWDAALLSALDVRPGASLVIREPLVVFPHQKAISESVLASSDAGDDTTLPVLRDRQETRRLIARHYPQQLRSSGIGGVVVLSLVIDEAGRVRDRWIAAGNQEELLNAAALQLATELRFIPARWSGYTVTAEQEFTVVFRP